MDPMNGKIRVAQRGAVRGSTFYIVLCCYNLNNTPKATHNLTTNADTIAKH
jgi:hypothetical protein